MKSKKFFWVIGVVVLIGVAFFFFQLEKEYPTEVCEYTNSKGEKLSVEYMPWDGCNTSTCTELGVASTEKFCK